MRILYVLFILPLAASAADPKSTSTSTGATTDYFSGRYMLTAQEGAARMKDADPSQQPFTNDLNKAGSQCIEGWSAYFGDYNKIQGRLKQIADEAHKIMADAEAKAGAPVSEADLAKVDACSGAGETMVTMLNQKSDQMRDARDAIGHKIDDFAQTLRIATQEFHQGALAKFKRSMSCPLQSTYLKPAKAAVHVLDSHHKPQEKWTSFDITKSVLYGYSNNLREKERLLGIYADKMKSLRKGCGN